MIAEVHIGRFSLGGESYPVSRQIRRDVEGGLRDFFAGRVALSEREVRLLLSVAAEFDPSHPSARPSALSNLRTKAIGAGVSVVGSALAGGGVIILSRMLH